MTPAPLSPSIRLPRITAARQWYIYRSLLGCLISNTAAQRRAIAYSTVTTLKLRARS